METSTFNESYAPKRDELQYLSQGLDGSLPGDAFYAPGFFVEPEMVQGFLKLFQLAEKLHGEGLSPQDIKLQLNSQAIAPKMVHQLALAKAQVMNHYALGKKLASILIENKPASAYEDEARDFLLEVAVQNADTIGFFREFFNFKDQDTDCFQLFVIHTVKVLYAMGYPDAAHHSSQVARLCVVKTAVEGASKIDILQSAMVGWLHDPKFDVNLSIDNLSTHPVVASAIAWHLLTHSNFESALTKVLSSGNMSIDTFAIGVAEALSINNDSRFVSERFIFDQVALQVAQQFKDEEKAKSMKVALWDRHQQRLAAPSQGTKPQPFGEELYIAISKTRLDSGLLGILKDAWRESCVEAGLNLTEQELDELYFQIVRGEYEDKNALQKITHALLARQSESHDAIQQWSVRGLSLFSHHDEVTSSGRISALALINSDPLLLSPHKILEVRPENEPLIDRLRSYIGSLDSNINDLPKASRESALSWQRSVFICILKGIQEMTGLDRLSRFYESHRYTPTQTDVDDLRQLILDRYTWKSFSEVSAQSDPKAFDDALGVFRDHYLAMCRDYRQAVMSSGVDESKLT